MVLATVMARMPARFNGKFNRTKGKVFIVLYYHSIKGVKGGLCISRICKLTATNSVSISLLAAKWVKWKYIKRKLGLNEHQRPCWVYTITDKGIRYVTEVMPPEVYDELYKEIMEHQRKGGMNVH